ncbi:hypothetical protein AVEN_40040-1 [Araneus ventricosus]|uniref:Uncharacterized protein n=1 Tax=Araneus ventricosus TaxID=182803 RepID=A0A4Y2KHB6_ARAVE|nr:hypothetical protein AVEN_40040-1 [Araneus ventricosus]
MKEKIKKSSPEGEIASVQRNDANSHGLKSFWAGTSRVTKENCRREKRTRPMEKGDHFSMKWILQDAGFTFVWGQLAMIFLDLSPPSIRTNNDPSSTRVDRPFY